MTCVAPCAQLLTVLYLIPVYDVPAEGSVGSLGYRILYRAVFWKEAY